MTRLFILMLAPGALVALHACGSSGAGSSGASPEGDKFIRDYCDAISGCCAGVGKTFDSGKCVSSYEAEASGQKFDPKGAMACLDGLHAAGASGTLCDWRTDERGPCLLVFTGNKKPGETCTITVPTECAPSSEGDVTCFQSSAEKICELGIDGAAGDSPCLATQEGAHRYGSPWNGAEPARGYLCETAQGLFCDPGTKACTKAPNVDTACDGSVSGYSCGATAYCDKATTKCVARPSAGGDCSSPGVICAMATFCDAMTMKCTPTLADGAPCRTQEMCTSKVCVQSTCGGNNSAFLSAYCK